MNKIVDYAGYAAFGVALTATLGSLVMSEVFHFAPCSLCWYQRIFMYPLVVVIGVAVMRRDNSWPLTTMLLAGIGWLIALYHSLLQWGILPHTLAPCTVGVPCITYNQTWFGFITIPFLSLLAFTTILAVTFVYSRGVLNEQRV
jgi:disulfide bond formation protein DsbB